MPYTPLLVRDVVLLCFPPEDTVFADAARRVAEDLTETPLPRAVEAALRARYPRVLVRERDPLASFGTAAWYLYREGRYSPFAGTSWWTDPAVARITIGDDGRYLDANPAGLGLLGTDLTGLRAAAPGSFTSTEYRTAMPWIRQLLLDTGELHSTAMLRPADGRPESEVEFHLTRDGDGSGRHVSAMRPTSGHAG